MMMVDKDTFRRRALELAAQDGRGLASRLAEEFGISRAAAATRLRTMVRAGLLEAEGKTRNRRWRLATLREKRMRYSTKGLEEERVWRELARPMVVDLPENVRDIWHYGVTEMVNNVIDHSGSPMVEVSIRRNALFTVCFVVDQGEGIFHKIQKALDLYDPRDALIELAKGKFTTDPEHHTGEGIFFCSKVFDCFQIHSSGLVFAHQDGVQDVMVEKDDGLQRGTMVVMEQRNDSTRKLREVMDEYAAPEAFTFSRTVVPVRLAVHEGEKLVSRSQAKRITFRFERFENVILDFQGVQEIGQAFADELFRVFSKSHPNTRLMPINMSPRVAKMVRRVAGPCGIQTEDRPGFQD